MLSIVGIMNIMKINQQFFTNCKPNITCCIILLLHYFSGCSRYLYVFTKGTCFFLLWRRTYLPQILCNITIRHFYPWPKIRGCYWLWHYECWLWHPLPLHPPNGWLLLPLPYNMLWWIS